jgi:hypothetical protein
MPACDHTFWTRLHGPGWDHVELTVGDINHDGRDDIVGYCDDWGLGWFNPTNNGWTKLHDGGWGDVALASADINHDGRDDIVGSYHNWGLGWHNAASNVWSLI